VLASLCSIWCGFHVVRINRFLGEIPELKVCKMWLLLLLLWRRVFLYSLTYVVIQQQQTLERLIDLQLDSGGADTDRLEHLLDLFQQLESIENVLNFEFEIIHSAPSTSSSLPPPHVDTSNNSNSSSNNQVPVNTIATTTTTRRQQ